MTFGRESWQHIQDNRLIILYMFISLCVFSYIYYLTAKSPINLDKSKVDQEEEEHEHYEDKYSMPMDHLKDPSNYNMQNFANTRQQHYDARDMGQIGVPAASGYM